MCIVRMLLVVVLASLIPGHADLSNEYNMIPMDLGENSFKSVDVDEEYIRHIHSMIDAYRSDMVGGRLIIETNALIDTKFKTWKRNADIINSLLALPKGMNDAGR